tara:strand:+ start:453 stop:2009 length:1557 start_codon:yes stop_codon:yes gene_type:complete
MNQLKQHQDDKAPQTFINRKLTKKERQALKKKRDTNLKVLYNEKQATGSKITPFTQASNSKCSYETVAAQQAHYETITSAQLKAMRQLLPKLLREFAAIKDPRNTKRIKHSMTVIMVFGLFTFLFRLSSRRQMNKKLTAPAITETLRKFFPEIDTIPHADTVARVLGALDYDANELQQIMTRLIKQLIRNKKFKKWLIKGRLPISIDGTQKHVREGQLQEQGWLVRKVGKGQDEQQYVYVLEANLTFKNGLTIPFMTEFCELDDEAFHDSESRQDCEIKAFMRLTDKMKKDFPRLKMLIILDHLYAAKSVLAQLSLHHWDYLIKLPAKLTQLTEILDDARERAEAIPNQQYYRERDQKFYWVNSCEYDGHVIHLVGCREVWKEVGVENSEIEHKYSDHRWISSLSVDINNVHELCNLAARKRALIEDSMNTEKHRGYRYERVLSYDWNAMKGFHLLMRLAHAMNAIAQFTKALKKHMKTLGIGNTFDIIFSALSNLWLSDKWIEKERQRAPQIRFDFS